jgi:hypothetical protein
MLISAGVFSFAMYLIVNLTPFTMAVESYNQNRQKAMQVSSEILGIYIKDLAGNLEKYLGGE